MNEYEHSYKVKSIEPFIDFCKVNGYKEISVTKQNRKVYENKNNPQLISRLTYEQTINNEKTTFDFKLSGKEIDGKKLSKESETLVVTKENKSFVDSILDVLDFILVADNFRTRYVYSKNDVIFEIDNYTKPEMKVVAIEGEENAVEKLCENELKSIIESNIIK